MTISGQPPSDSAESQYDDEVSILALVRFLLQYRYLIAGSALVTALMVVGASLAGPRSYTSQAAFIPHGGGARGSAGALGALAGQLGVSFSQGEPTQSPTFYANLLGSRELIGRLAMDTLEIREGSEVIRRPVVDFLGIEEERPLVRRENSIRILSRLISASATTTGVVELQATTPSAELSAGLARSLVSLVNDFNLEMRQAAAAAESRFVEERMREAEADLSEVEGELRDFLEANRQFQGSPQLMFEYERLQRQVFHQQQVFTTLQQALESARFARVRDTPLITVVEAPEQPVYPDSRRIPLRGAVGLVLGGILGVVIAFFRSFAAREASSSDPEYQKLREVWKETLEDLRLRRKGNP